MNDDFSNYPASVTEIRSDKTQKAKDWSPRDALIKVLRDLDSGALKPDAIVIMWSVGTGGEMGWAVASPSPIQTVGLVSRAQHLIHITYDD